MSAYLLDAAGGYKETAGVLLAGTLPVLLACVSLSIASTMPRLAKYECSGSRIQTAVRRARQLAKDSLRQI